jgi:hypothetical protein
MQTTLQTEQAKDQEEKVKVGGVCRGQTAARAAAFAAME